MFSESQERLMCKPGRCAQNYSGCEYPVASRPPNKLRYILVLYWALASSIYNTSGGQKIPDTHLTLVREAVELLPCCTSSPQTLHA